MVRTTGEDDPDEHSGRGTTHKQAWIRTREDMESMADQRRENGWDVVAVPAGDTATVSRDAGDTDRFGFVHVIPDNYAEAFVDAFEAGEFPRYEAYQNEVEGHVYLVTELLDPGSATAIMIAGRYDLRDAPAMIETAREEGLLYTHVQRLDGTLLGSFRHEEFEPLVPDQVDNWSPKNR